MHREILTKEQVALLPLLKMVNKDFGLVGGTAVALQIGHRRSIDFDLFSHKEFKNAKIKRNVARIAKITKIIVNRPDEYTFFINDVKITFYYYPYDIPYGEEFNAVIKMPDLLTLAAMKALALGQRAKWKDYVDLYFIAKDFFSLSEISKKGRILFGEEFNEKLFRIQLSYFNDIDYSEPIEFLPGFSVSDKKVKKELIKFSLE